MKAWPGSFDILEILERKREATIYDSRVVGGMGGCGVEGEVMYVM
jgi:hypothetical protein